MNTATEKTKKYKPYPEYKDSGIEWINKIPKHWEALRFKYTMVLQRGYDLPAEQFIEGEYPVCGSNGIIGYHNEYTTKGPSFTIGRSGSVGEVNYFAVNFWAHNTSLFAKDFIRVLPRFAYYLLIALDVKFLSAGSAVGTLNRNYIHDLLIVLPKKGEQQNIADFLDRRTSEIDELIAKKEQLIELLTEKRTAIISHTVTKGLNPDAPVKDSGINWLGEIPEHWKLVPTKFVIKARPGAIKTGPFGSQLLSSEMLSGTVKVYNQRSVLDRDFEAGENYISEEKYEELRAFTVYPNDILITTRGTIGHCAIVPTGAEQGILHPCLIRIQADERKVLIEYLSLLIQDGTTVQTQLCLMSNATTIEVIYSDSLRKVKLPLPPIKEQKQILNYCSIETAKIDALIAKVIEAIEKLKEYRTALISAAVTGKTDVRREAN